MKQRLFYLVSVAALLASCTNDDFLSQEQGQPTAPQSEGIVFKVAEDPATKGEFNTDAAGAFYTSWNAEVDNIGIVYSGAVKGLTGSTAASANIWNEQTGASRGLTAVTAAVNLGPSIATYKATRSGSYGWVTAVDNGDILKFAGEESDPDDQVMASFRIFRPIGSPSAEVNYTNTAEGVESMLVNVPAFNEQTQEGWSANFDNFFMVADPIDDVWSGTNAVGEELTLKFERPFAAMAIRTNGYDKNVYGELKSVTVAAEESSIAWSDKGTVDIAKKVEGAWVIEGTDAKSVKLTIGEGSNGLEWSDGAWAFIQILPVDRSTYKAAEDYTISLEFANGTIVVNKSTTNSWAANSFVKVTADLETQDFVYLSTNNTLIVNKKMPTVAEDEKFDGTNLASKVKSFVSNVALTANELKTLKGKFTNVKTLTLANQSADLGENLANLNTGITSLTLTEATEAPKITNYAGLTALSCPKATSIPEAAYQGNSVLAKANFPAVVTIGDNAFDGAAEIRNIACADAENTLIVGTTDKKGKKTSALTTIGSFAFNGCSMVKVDAPAVTTMGARAFGSTALATTTDVLLPKYDFADPYNAMALLGGSALETVDLSSVPELGVTTISFNQTTLTTVTLKEGVKIEKSAFAGCTALATVKNLDKAAVVGDNAFSGCTAITSALINSEAIGNNAFNGCNTLATLTLGGNVKTIGEGAFSGCTTLSTLNNLANITSIGKEAFKGTAIPAFDFMAATLGEGAFQNCTSLKGQVRSNVTVLEKNVFNAASAVSTFTFPNVTTIKEGALVGLLNTNPYATITFGVALTAIDGKAFSNSVAATTANDGSTAAKAIAGTSNCNLILSDKTGLTIATDGKTVTYKATDGKYYAITFRSVQ